MQETRQHILEILRERGEATVDDIVADLQRRRGNITPVTVRHHLTQLQKDNLITTPQLRHRSAPGRPQHIYALSEQAHQYFPNNYQPLLDNLLQHLKEQLPPREVNVILEGVADRMAAEAEIPDTPFPEKLDHVVTYLNEHGYNARWETHADGYLLQTTNCPYHQFSNDNIVLCDMDMRLVASLLGVVPRLLERMSAGDASCTYLIPDRSS